ncbi:MAG TPA: PAS domain S-box protein [Ignavibacteriaceae bacterium]|nr:PAS domain S-box protein [Ignavibacteriaceae bacterium]
MFDTRPAQSPKILIVEDEQIVALDIATNLKSFGYEIAGVATTGENALKLTVEENPDLILMDIKLDGSMDGIQTAKKIQTEHKIPVIYLSAYTDEKTLMRAKLTEPHGFLLKPFERKELRASIETALYKYRTEEQLRSSEAELQALFSAMNDIVLVFDNKGKIVKSNTEAFNKSGKSLIGRNMYQIFPQKEADKLLAHIGTALHTGENVNDEIKLMIENDEKWFSVSVSRMHDDFILWVAREITLTKKTEKALRESEERYRHLVEYSPDIVGVHRDGILLFINPAGTRIFGVENAEKIIGKPVSEMVHPNSRNAFLKQLKSTGSKEQPSSTEIKVTKLDGSVIYLETLAIPVIYEGNYATQFVARDDTAHKTAEKERENLFKQVSETQKRLKILSRRLIEVQESERRTIARELHDEIGQSLTAIKINLQSMKEGVFDEAGRNHFSESIDLVEHSLDQVRNLSLDLRPSMLDDLGLFPTLRWYLIRQAERSGINAVINAEKSELEDLSPELEITVYRISQEAITNIIRHSDAKNLRVDLWLSDDNLHLKIKDDGRGFDVKKAKKLAIGGKSIGILGMQERVELLGGSIEISSSFEAGTEIHAVLPVNISSHKYQRFFKKKNS